MTRGRTAKHYEYKFVKASARAGRGAAPGGAFEACQDAILAGAQQGWRFQQIVISFNERTGVYGAGCYPIIFEKEAD
ncbi:DUF4177 domain-containing protein [Feifania hominis]|uniref:DUF4177 domain-containing protein n=1 Tax=Feifania hominis TaxID=2763660 RepID=A0A926DFT1_9FIRM|nr:DUF4177 domain-containing protein [Feifania hominis]MBC8536994.1 DUF4177 domain-containing protein [Feifania hominis]